MARYPDPAHSTGTGNQLEIWMFHVRTRKRIRYPYRRVAFARSSNRLFYPSPSPVLSKVRTRSVTRLDMPALKEHSENNRTLQATMGLSIGSQRPFPISNT